ncbi:hypothetical protein HBA54_26030 [Pelagibius litoralis]|uniref:Uncharacterized protein n=1 Tax=Pelagibius litoralis TaxID=374515 RepID=A0A967F302_9PROT|nr:hypothetical protein [Pelagibius litoralis]NIA72064.1 hypothetical protein [Pelagibius litoralis]
MTHLPTDEKKPQIFTHTLSNVMLMIVLVFFISNVFVIQSCKSRYLLDDRGSVCSVVEVFAPLRQVIPVIYRPAEVLEARGDQDRADLVVAAYSFSWGGFLIFSALMIVVAVVRVRLLSDQDRRKYVSWSIQHDREHQTDSKHAESAALGLRFFAFTTVLVFIWTFWGFFSFDEPSFLKNMVHERNRDLYQPAVFLSFILLFLILLIGRQIKRYLSKTPTL